ncbi:GH92 family glycosyl hydrolase [Rubrivirga sp.]|uniref:GH92 family glycosyl hydrolase n=1 Tax=Rubrivirga sp. TaxID=1885344 RepID=UPI003B51CB5C
MAQDRPVDLADPLVGTEDGGGATFPGAALPFSLVRLGPDTPLPQNTSGYVPWRPIDGFSHTHVSGTGGPGKYGNVFVTVQTGPLDLESYTSDKAGETARPGFYGVDLTRWGARAELAAAGRAALHRYTFEADTARVLFDLARAVDVVEFAPTRLVQGNVRVVGDREVEGYGTYRGGWGPPVPYRVYFAARFRQPFVEHGTWTAGQAARGADAAIGDSTGVGAFLTFDTSDGEPVVMEIGISLTSVDRARANRQPVEGVAMETVRERGEAVWDEHLGTIRVEGGSEDQRRMFYSALYNTMLMPTDVTGENPRWTSSEPHYWDYFALWDTYRAVHPLFTLVRPERQRDMVRSLVDTYRHTGWLPECWTSGTHGFVQGGSNGVVVLADAAVKGLEGIDYETAYQAAQKDADRPSPQPGEYGRDSDEYLTLGYSSTNKWCGSSRTLEYALNDFAVAQLAETLGHDQDAARYRARSLNSYNLFMPDTKFFWARTPEGEWEEGFAPDFQIERWWEGPYFYEGQPWHYSTFVPHDVGGLIRRHGGPQAFTAHLDRLFDEEHYAHHNEPGLLSPYLYVYAGRPDKTAERVRHILATEYAPVDDGLPGQDDAGAMSAWYVFSALGFYPNAGQDVYLVGSPLFPRATLDLGDGRELVVTAENVSEANRYVQSATLNGRPLVHAWFRHGQIADGGTLAFVMGPEPSSWGRDADPPPSVSDDPALR